MDSEVIKSFLVGLGFGVDDASLAKFNKAIVSASIKVAALYAGIQTAAAGIFYSISHMSKSFEDIGYELRLVAPAINKFLIMRQAMLDAYKRAGINLTKVVQQSILFNYSLAKTKFALEAVYKSVGAKFLPLLTKQMDIFRQKIFANMPKIQEHLMKLVTFLFKAFDATVQFGSRVWEVLGRVWDGLKKLDDITGGWSTKILAFIAIWKYLNLGFLATPFGMVIAGITALIALYDDFKVWQEGGQSLIDWGSDTTKMIVGITAVITGLVGAIKAVQGVIKLVTIAQWLWDAAMMANPIGLIIAGVVLLTGLLTALAAKFGFFKGMGDYFFGDTGAKLLNLLGGNTAAPNTAGVTNPQPLTPWQQYSNATNINQVNNTHIQGVPDAHAVGREVDNVSARQNFDLTRNLGKRGAW